MYRVVIVAVILAAFSGCGGESDDGGVGSSGSGGSSTASGPSTEEIMNAGQNQIAEMHKGIVTDATAVLRGVTDVASAKAAKAKLEAIAARGEPIRNSRENARTRGVSHRVRV